MTRRAAPLACAVVAAACSGGGLGATGVEVSIVTESQALWPSVIELVWLDDTQPILKARVPEKGRLSSERAGSVLVYIELVRGAPGPRRVVARGLVNDAPVSEGAARTAVEAGSWTAVKVSMSAWGDLPDLDGDGIPDVVDNCPRVVDPCSNAPGDAGPSPPPPDAAALTPPDAPVDTADPIEGPPPDRAEPDRPDAPPPPDARDGSLDLPRGDLPRDLPRPG